MPSGSPSAQRACSSIAEHRPYKPEVAGAGPAAPTNILPRSSNRTGFTPPKRGMQVRVLLGAPLSIDGSSLSWSPWQIPEKRIVNNGYAYVRIPNHPKATNTGYVYEHRVVAENKLGRFLNSDEVVHHVNFDRLDNRPENLLVLTHAQHASLHGLLSRKKYVILKCPSCGKVFEREKRNTHLSKHGKLNATFCSNHCRGVMARRIQLEGITQEMSSQLSSNVICEITR